MYIQFYMILGSGMKKGPLPPNCSCNAPKNDMYRTGSLSRTTHDHAPILRVQIRPGAQGRVHSPTSRTLHRRRGRIERVPSALALGGRGWALVAAEQRRAVAVRDRVRAPPYAVLDDALHHRGVLHAARAALRDVVFVPVRLVDDLLRDHLLDDVFERDDADRAAFDAGRAAEEEQVRTACLARVGLGLAWLRWISEWNLRRNVQVVEGLEAVDVWGRFGKE